MADRTYYGTDGDPISLDTLCRREPEWAASRIRANTNEVAALRARVAELEAGAYALGRIETLRRCGSEITVDVDVPLSELDVNHATDVECARQWLAEADRLEAEREPQPRDESVPPPAPESLYRSNCPKKGHCVQGCLRTEPCRAEQASTYGEVMAAAQRASREVESWPEWKRALSEPEPAAPPSSGPGVAGPGITRRPPMAPTETPREKLKRTLDENAKRWASYPAEVRAAISTTEVFSVSPPPAAPAPAPSTTSPARFVIGKEATASGGCGVCYRRVGDVHADHCVAGLPYRSDPWALPKWLTWERFGDQWSISDPKAGRSLYLAEDGCPRGTLMWRPDANNLIDLLRRRNEVEPNGPT